MCLLLFIMYNVCVQCVYDVLNYLISKNSSPTSVFQTAHVLALYVPYPTYSFGEMSHKKK